MYESVELKNLPQIDYDALYTRLAEWYLTVLPNKHNNSETLNDTGVPIKFFDKVQSDLYRLPASWHFWKRRGNLVDEDESQGKRYEGAAMDSYSMEGAAVKELIGWDPMVSIAGGLPGSFRRFLKAIGNQKANVGNIEKRVGHTLREHGKTAYAEYNRLVLEAERRSKEQIEVTTDSMSVDENVLEWTQGLGNLNLANHVYYDQARQQFDQDQTVDQP
jgi:hypothetical protein